MVMYPSERKKNKTRYFRVDIEKLRVYSIIYLSSLVELPLRANGNLSFPQSNCSDC